jgi:hypothetical protein
MGVPTDAVRASSHCLGQQWSLAFRLHKQHPDGILYPSLLNEEINLGFRFSVKAELAVPPTESLTHFATASS